jgi:hypothetical protein
MKILPDNRQKAIFEKRYWKLTRKVFVQVRQQVIDKAEFVDGDRLKGYVRGLLNEKVMKDHIDNLWGEVGGQNAYYISRQLLKAKSQGGEIEIKGAADELEKRKAKMRAYSAERSLKKTASILSTETEAINKVIDDTLDTALTDGYGILETRKAVKSALEGDELATIENWQAQRIALTEVAAAQSAGAWEETQGRDGLMKKWIFIPGLKTYRENHAEYGNMDLQEMDYEYTDGLKYPHDPEAAAEEVINCYCDYYYETGD